MSPEEPIAARWELRGCRWHSPFTNARRAANERRTKARAISSGVPEIASCLVVLLVIDRPHGPKHAARRAMPLRLSSKFPDLREVMLVGQRPPAVGVALKCPGGLFCRGLPASCPQSSGVYPWASSKIVSNPRDSIRWQRRLTATAYCRGEHAHARRSRLYASSCGRRLRSSPLAIDHLTISLCAGADAICSAPSAHVLTELRSRPRIHAIYCLQTRK